jgi:hypothetical protein
MQVRNAGTDGQGLDDDAMPYRRALDLLGG